MSDIVTKHNIVADLKKPLKQNNFNAIEAQKLLQTFGCEKPMDCINIIGSELALELKNKMILDKWLRKNKMPNDFIQVIELKSKSLQGLSALYWSEKRREFMDAIHSKPELKKVLDSLPKGNLASGALAESIWMDINREGRISWSQTLITWLARLLGVAVIATLVIAIGVAVITILFICYADEVIAKIAKVIGVVVLTLDIVIGVAVIVTLIIAIAVVVIATFAIAIADAVIATVVIVFTGANIATVVLAIALAVIATVSNLGTATFISFATGGYLAPDKCTVAFDWTDPVVVGNTMSFVIQFFQRNGRPYPISEGDNLLVEIAQGSQAIPSTIELGGSANSASTARVQYTSKRSGSYSIRILVGPNLSHIPGSPFTNMYFLPTDPSAQETVFLNYCSTVVCAEREPQALSIEMRDKYGNLCPISPNFDASDDFSVALVEMSSGKSIDSASYWDTQSNLGRIALVLNIDIKGLYSAVVTYRGSVLKNGEFNIIVLNSSESAFVQKNSNPNSQYSVFSAQLLSVNNERLNKPKKVFCFITPKQLTIKEYILKIIPKRIVTFRLCPSTKFLFTPSSGRWPASGEANSAIASQYLVIDDGCQPPVELMSAERTVMAATFIQFLLSTIGGSETFKDKENFFYSEVRKYHQKSSREKCTVSIDRQRLLESSMRATNGLSVGQWCKNFVIQFAGEPGVDCGGLRREWFEILTRELFDPNRSDLFRRFKNDKQGLVHPNPHSQFEHKYYEFAGKVVGKCLYESSLGSTYRQLLKARFSRSFLAQLIGLRVHYRHFERDDPELYVSKIKYIIENSVEDMELYFTEEVYDLTSGKLIRTVELIPNGAKVKVTDSNKLRYLDALAQYRLSTSVRAPVQHFLKGLNDLIPDNLLCIFDENELELLMCGAGSYSIAEFKANHVVISSGLDYGFEKILDWFWSAVSNFTDEEMARLLQFTTGCSQLPPGGFAELSPKFQITSAPTVGVLPTAHTCFNQLCLPAHDTYEQFDRALRLAINEGSEGFGMS